MKTMTKLNSLNQAQLKLLSDKLCDKIEDLLDYFQLSYKFNGKMISMSCPIHDGDNQSALNIYPYGDRYRGNWVCRTHNCEKNLQPSIIGFIRGLLSKDHNDGKIIPFDQTIDFCLDFVDANLKDLRVKKSDIEKNNFTQLVEKIKDSKDDNVSRLSKEYVLKCLDIPAQYYIDRNYSKEILIKYDVGLCNNPTKEMYNRVVVPVYDQDGLYLVGCTGRSVYQKCENCSYYHKESCPAESEAYKYSKWKHNNGFKSQNHLYNIWFAKQHIYDTGIAIIVESPGNVWRLEENGIHNSIAIFGSSISDRQKMILDGSGAMKLVILTDNDAAGQKAKDIITKKCEKTYKIYSIEISKLDVGDMSTVEIEQEIKPFLKKIQ
jgi:5S rRNA maturation endonuclease (ribonuclease M5)